MNIFRKKKSWISDKERMAIIEKSAKEVTRGVFFSTVIIITSFLPIFLLTGQEGKLFHPLAFTKTFILIIDAVLLVTLAPVLLSFFLKGTSFKADNRNGMYRLLHRIYTPILCWVFKYRKTTLVLNILALAIAIPLMKNIGTEFMPTLDEQSILFMPVTLPDISNTEVKRILSVQDKIIKSFPEVDKVLGKAGRASTATDNAPLSMIETIIMLKPKSEWRKGMTKQKIIQELDKQLQIPGVTNGWTQPIINRINMLATGIRTDVGIKIYGPNLDTIAVISDRVRNVLSNVKGVADLYVESVTGAKYLTIIPKREILNRYGLSTDVVNEVVESALGGKTISNTIEGRRRFPVTLRMAEDYRNSIENIKRIPVNTQHFGDIPLGEVARIQIENAPLMYLSENGQLRGAIMFNVRDRDLGSTVADAMQKVNSMDHGRLPTGYFFEWSGQYEHLVNSQKTLLWIIPLVIIIIFFALYFAFYSVKEALLSLITLPFALVGGVYIIYFNQVHLSVAVVVGFIALFGIAVETGIVMVIYLNDALRELARKKGNSVTAITVGDLKAAVMRGAVQRVRPKIMTVCISLFGLIPVLWADGVGSDVMKPIILPMIGGVFTSSIHILLVTPLLFLMSKEYELKKYGKFELYETTH